MNLTSILSRDSADPVMCVALFDRGRLLHLRVLVSTQKTGYIYPQGPSSKDLSGTTMTNLHCRNQGAENLRRQVCNLYF